METKEKKSWKTVLKNRVDKTEWDFPTLAVSNFSGILVEMTCGGDKTGEGIGVVVGSTINRTWRLRNFTPVFGDIERIEVTKKAKA